MAASDPTHPSAFQEALQAGAVMAAFAALGLGAAGLLGAAAPSRPPPYPSEPMELWLLDGYNVLHAGLLEERERSEPWWTAACRERVVTRAAAFEDPEARIQVVWDGADASGDGPATPRVTSVYAPSADDWLLARVKAAAEPSRLAVVTADRRLAARARHHGARAVSPRSFLSRCSPG